MRLTRQLLAAGQIEVIVDVQLGAHRTRQAIQEDDKTSLGAAIAVAVSAQLLVGLSGIPNPYEWEWAYNTIFVLALVLFAFAPGRVFGIDALLRPRFLAAKARGSFFGKVLSWLT